jgi:2-polyprenyl-3-methyl-5-hydroxy-6-metoxy-1,4-benzoquinol methylase
MENVNCNLCGRDEWRVRYPSTLHSSQELDVDVFRCTSPGYGSHTQIVECNHCGLVYANPRWTMAEIEAAYEAVEDETYVDERAGREITFRKHLAALEKWTGPGNGRALLDVGAYIGVFVEAAAGSGWDAWGIEPSNWAVDQAQKQGLPVYQGTQDAPILDEKLFDVVTMWDVIEHVSNPVGELKKSFDLLKPGGWLAVHTMNIDSMTARLMGSRWPWLMDMHLTYFSQKTLAAMLRTAGFEVIWSGTQGRYLSLGYLATRLGGLHEGLGRAASSLVQRLRLERTAIPINSGDLFTVYAQRPLGI